MNIKFGPSIDGSIEEAKAAFAFSNEVVEIGFTRISKIIYAKRAINLISKFKYRSIHMPVLNDNNIIHYPDPSIDKWLNVIDIIITEINPHTILFHPDQVDNFNWANKKYGNRLAFENMDSRKSFGKTVEDMSKVFELCPNAKFVLDVNHAYTNDKTMKLADSFYSIFRDRLIHYHLSGFGGFHNALCTTREDIILNGIKSFDIPIVHEGNLLANNLLKKEFKYISKRI